MELNVTYLETHINGKVLAPCPLVGMKLSSISEPRCAPPRNGAKVECRREFGHAAANGTSRGGFVVAIKDLGVGSARQYLG